jgi:drug/metabolite transporter (DMT)-like permease
MQKSKMAGYVAGTIAASLMASLGIFVQHIYVNAQIIALARFGIGLLFMFFQLIFSRKLHEIKQVKLSISLVFSGVSIALCIWFYIKALDTISLVNSVFLLYLGPLIATALSAIFLKELYKRSNLLLLFLSLLGCLFIFEFKLPLYSYSKWYGYLWGMLSAIFYAIFIILNRTISSATPALIRSFYQLLWGTITLLVLLGDLKIDWVYTDIYWLISVGFIHGFLALTLMIYTIEHLETYEYATISYLEPLVATLLGILVYKEVLSFWQILGCLMILTAGIKQVFLTKNN